MARDIDAPARAGNAWGRYALEALAIAVAVGVPVHLALRHRGSIAEGDTLYHFKMAALIFRNGPWVDVSWLPLTVLGERGTDHQWLWHLLIAPFAAIGDPQLAIHVAGAATCAAVVAVILLVCRGLAIPYAPLAAILVICADGTMPERLTRLRSENVMYAFLPLALLFMARRRHVALFFLSWIFVESYHGAVFLLPMVLAFGAASVLAREPLPIRSAIAVLGGLAAGLILSPWFPQNVDYLLFHTLFKLQSQNLDLVGMEWHKPPWLHVGIISWLMHLLLASALCLYAARRRADPSLRLRVETIAALLLTLICLAMYKSAYRNGVYYALFAMFSALLLWRDAAVRLDRKNLVKAFTVASCAASAVVLWVGVGRVAVMPTEVRPLQRYASIMQYVAERARPGELVFNVDWPSFTFLFWQSDRFRYVSGLDGNYLAFADPRRFQVWYDIYRQVPIPGGASKVLREEFDTRWVVIPRSERYDRIAMGIIDGGEAETMMLNGDGWLIHLGKK